MQYSSIATETTQNSLQTQHDFTASLRLQGKSCKINHKNKQQIATVEQRGILKYLCIFHGFNKSLHSFLIRSTSLKKIRKNKNHPELLVLRFFLVEIIEYIGLHIRMVSSPHNNNQRVPSQIIFKHIETAEKVVMNSDYHSSQLLVNGTNACYCRPDNKFKTFYSMQASL